MARGKWVHDWLPSFAGLPLCKHKSAFLPLTFILSPLSLQKFASQIHFSLTIVPRGNIET